MVDGQTTIGVGAAPADAPIKSNSWYSVSGYDIVRVFLGSVVLVAGVLKAHQLATEPVAENSLFTSRWFLIGVVEFELLFGVWLLFGLFPRATRLVSITFFFAMACVGLYKALSGEASCGCFGSVPINPWYTFTFDLLALTGLAISRPGHRLHVRWRANRRERSDGRTLSYHVLQYQTRLTLVVAVWLVLGTSAAMAMRSFSAASLDEQGGLIGDGSTVVVEPSDAWLGKRLPLLKYIDVGDQLALGEWWIVIVHHGCPKCESLLQDLWSRGSEKQRLDSSRFAIVEIPPYRLAEELDFQGEDRFVHGKLTDRYEWFVTTPLIMTVIDGKVSSYGEKLTIFTST